MHNPGKQHMNAVICILRYMIPAPGKGLLSIKNTKHQSTEVYAYVDCDDDVNDRLLLRDLGCLSKQPIYRSLANVFCEALWLRLFFPRFRLSF